MKNTKKMHPGCLYLFEGQASSSSCFIQSEQDAKEFILTANLLLRDFVKIHEYNLSKDSWYMIVSLRSKDKIIKSYRKKREKSTTCNRKNDHTEIWKIISEQMRQFLKQYVTEANKRSGRQGSLVKAPYKRSYFESMEEVQDHIKKIRMQLLKKVQKLKKYRGRKKFFKIAKKKIDGHVFLCTNWKNTKEGIKNFVKKIQADYTDFIDFKDFMSLNLIKRTLNSHNPKTST